MRSRFYEDILFAVEAGENSANAEELYKKLWDRFRGLSAVHTNNNAAVCVSALIMGKGDFVRSVGIAVGAGWDTDCNGATVGSFLGALLSVDAIPEYLITPPARYAVFFHCRLPPREHKGMRRKNVQTVS